MALNIILGLMLTAFIVAGFAFEEHLIRFETAIRRIVLGNCRRLKRNIKKRKG